VREKKGEGGRGRETECESVCVREEGGNWGKGRKAYHSSLVEKMSQSLPYISFGHSVKIMLTNQCIKKHECTGKIDVRQFPPFIS
jgi:hypothetical protein